MMRWWWFGPAVTKPEIQLELEQMKAAGIGGVEFATVYPLALDNPLTGFGNQTFLSDEHIENLRFAAEEANRLGLRVDLTLTSGWPYGGPHIPVTEAAGELRVEKLAIDSGARSIAIPSISAGEQLIAVFAIPNLEAPEFKGSKLVPLASVKDGRLQISPEFDGFRGVVFFISSRTGMMVKRPALGAEGFVLDHYDESAIATHLHSVGERLMQAFGDLPPYAVFSDSLEDYGSDWTGDLLFQFQQRRGYDLTPYLLDLISEAGPETSAIRHDWGRTLTELANEHYLLPLHTWAQQHHTLLRSQTYGFPPVSLSSNRFEDLPEGEGEATLSMWRQFSDTRWAASAGHVFGKPVISSETWTWLHSPAFRATPLDMKVEADLHFLQGVNQIVGHGWPYSPPTAAEPGWHLYAAGAFNAHNPWWFAMPDLAGYLQRVSFALRQGSPANDVALLLPNDDAWARFKATSFWSRGSAKPGHVEPSNVSLNESMPQLLGKNVIPQILDAGFNLDFIDADAIETQGIRYPVLVLPAIERIPVASYQKIDEYASHGGVVIATRRLPSASAGFLNAEAETQQIQRISEHLFRSKSALGHFVEDETQLGTAIQKFLKPDVSLSPRVPEIGFIHRHLSRGDLYLIVNTSNRALRVRAKFRQAALYAESWDAFSGRIEPVVKDDKLDLSLQPYESRLIFFTNSVTSSAPHPHSGNYSNSIDLSKDWNLTFSALHQTIRMARLHSWTEEENFKFYSGPVIYEKIIDLPSNLSSRSSAVLDFGEGVPVTVPDPLPEINLRAFLEGPVREAAEVYINGARAGVVWHPPYIIDISHLIRPGKNELRIEVGNTAINSLAGKAVPSYRLLNDRYGARFVPQDMDNLQLLPSGVLGPVRLEISSVH